MIKRNGWEQAEEAGFDPLHSDLEIQCRLYLRLIRSSHGGE
jgi:hypothetical protein